MSGFSPADFAALYARFNAPISALDCGSRCAPYNERGVPFCCDTGHAVATAYEAEWSYLQAHTDLWRPWRGPRRDMERLEAQLPHGQVLIACRGAEYCQRNYRSLACRSFPFFPYFSQAGEFLGLTYYWEYEDRCWVISNLQAVSGPYRAEFIDLYDRLFERMPEERESFRGYSAEMRSAFSRRGRAIPLLHRNGQAYKVTPRSGRLRQVSIENLPKFGPYRLAAEMPFPDEAAAGG